MNQLQHAHDPVCGISKDAKKTCYFSENNDLDERT